MTSERAEIQKQSDLIVLQIYFSGEVDPVCNRTKRAREAGSSARPSLNKQKEGCAVRHQDGQDSGRHGPFSVKYLS